MRMRPINMIRMTGVADVGPRRTKPQGRRFLATALLGVGSLALAWSEAGARPSTAVPHADWQRKCEGRAEHNKMRQKLRAPFIKQCVAGYRINAGKDLQAKKEKF